MLTLKLQNKTNPIGYFQSYFSDLFTNKKRELVKLELDLIPQVHADWQTIIGSTSTNRLQAESSIKNCYHNVGLGLPNIIWVEHPLAAIKILINRPDLCDVSGTIINTIWQSELEIQQSIDPESATRVLTNINPQHILKTLVGDCQIAPITDRLNQLVMSRANSLYFNLTERTIPAPLQDYHISDLGYFDYFLRIGVNIPKIQPEIDLAKSCGWCWTFEDLAILTPKPSKIKLDRQGEIIGIIYNGVNILNDRD
jgi:hypothetical protein